MIYKDSLYGSSAYKSNSYTGTWDKSYSFTYLAGTTVSLTLAINATIPLGTTLLVYAGESVDSLTLVPNGVKTPILFTSTTSGATNLYVKVVMTRTGSDTPILTSLGLTIEQETSLYTISTSILSDALTPSNGEWTIDTELQKYLIPYAWFAPVNHREAIGKVAEAAGGVAYQDRYGKVTVEAANYAQRMVTGTPLDVITDSRILNASSPVSDVRNRIQIQTSPYIPKLDPEVVWIVPSNTKINDGEQLTFNAVFSDYDAVIDCTTIIGAGITIISEEFFSYGATIVIEGTIDNTTVSLQIDGTPLVKDSVELIERTDGDSIRRNGDRALSIMDNALIQSSLVAGTIADDILATTKQEARDILISWRGDPTLELGDEISINGQAGVIITQEFNYNGALSASLQMRKV